MTGEPVVPGRATLTTEQAARLLGVDRSTLYRLAMKDKAPVPYVKVGRSLKWPIRPILELLQIGPEALTDRP